MYFELTQWISHDIATQEEKEKYKKEFECMGGYLKKLSYKDAFKASWNKSSKEDREKIKLIPGFDKDKFFQISGIEVEE